MTRWITIWFGALMVIMCLALAGAFAFTDFYSDRMVGTKRTGFIIILILYAVYRGFRTYSLLKAKQQHEG